LLAIFGGYAIYSLNQIKINGARYRNIMLGKELIADILPPPQYLVEAHLTAFQLCDTREPAEFAALKAKFANLEWDYRKRREFWGKQALQGDVKALLVEEAYRPGMAMLDLIREKMLPALEKERRAEAVALLQGPVREKYEEHRVVIDEIIRTTSVRNRESEVLAEGLARDRTRHLLYLGIVLLAMLGASYWILRRMEVDHSRAQGALKDSERRYQTLFESAGDAILVLREGRLIECNGKALEMFRAKREEIVGSTPADFSPPLQPDGTPSPIKAKEKIERAFAGNPQFFEWKHMRADGTEFDAEVGLNAVGVEGKPTLFGIVRDISERKAIEQALVESETRFRQMAENIQEVFFLIEEKTREVLYVSPLVESLLEIPLHAIMSRPLELAGLVHPEDRDSVAFLDEKKRYGEALEEEFRIVVRSGAVRWLRLKSFPIRDGDGRVFRLVGVVSDITDTKRAQEESRRWEQQLLQADKLSSLGLMVAGAAHEINNPNNLIMLNSDMLQTLWKRMGPAFMDLAAQRPQWTVAGIPGEFLPGKIEALLQGITGGANRIQRIVDNLKDFARVDAGGMAPVALEKVTQAAVGLMDNLIRKSTHRFSLSIPEGLPRVRGNFQKLEQVVVNLIANACQSLSDKSQAVEVSLRHDGEHGRVVLEVRDEGRGIPEEIRSRVLDPFFTTKRQEGGTGLGLSVSYGIVKDHHGEIQFESGAGEGTTFRLGFPVFETLAEQALAAGVANPAV
jgi:PAS domain S-box-containing protein